MLYHPAKYSYNLEYIQTAIQCLELMVAEEPMITAQNSIKRILWAVEQSISRERGEIIPTPLSMAAAPAKHHHHEEPTPSHTGPLYSNRIWPAINHDRTVPFSGRTEPVSTHALPGDQPTLDFPLADQDSGLDPLLNFNLDIMTTDLSNFFPMNILTPGDHSFS